MFLTVRQRNTQNVGGTKLMLVVFSTRGEERRGESQTLCVGVRTLLEHTSSFVTAVLMNCNPGVP